MKVDIDKVNLLLDQIAEINRIPFSEIEWQQQGRTLDISEEILERWKYIGLNNTEFVGSEFYLEE